MPIYEYKCRDCEHELEKLQKISDDPLTECPECGKPALKKMISAVGFRLKGSGWYETDFKNGGKKAASDSDSNAQKTESSESASNKTDSAKSEGTQSRESKADSTKTDSAKKDSPNTDRTKTDNTRASGKKSDSSGSASSKKAAAS